MTADTQHTADPAIEEPTRLQNLWSSISGVFAKEARWRMRGRRAFIIVTIYVALLGLLVVAIYRLIYDRAVFDAGFNNGFQRLDVVSASASTAIGQAIFVGILIVQTLLTLMVAPALTSGAIAMEREKQTLDMLITTPLSTLGMVIGKLISSLAYVLLLIVGSLPLMAVVFTFGGIAPEDVVRAYVMLVAVAFGVGSIGLFVSALLKRTQMATAVSYVVVLLLTIGSLAFHSYILASALPRDFDGRPLGVPARAPEPLLWLNPLVADIDLACTAIPDSYGFTCSYIGTVTGQEIDPANPPRDVFWPRSAAGFVVMGVVLTLLTTQLIAPSRRVRSQRSRSDVAEAAT